MSPRCTRAYVRSIARTPAAFRSRPTGGRVLDVRGSAANPYTAGVICNKVVRSYPEFVHGSGRLMRPMKRVGRRGGNGFEPLSWDEALDLIHGGISGAAARHGPRTVLPLNYAGPHGGLAGGSMDRRFFHRLGASLLARGQLCGIVAQLRLPEPLRPLSGDAARADSPLRPDRGVGPQRHGVQPASRAGDPGGTEGVRRPADRRRPEAHAHRRAGTITWSARGWTASARAAIATPRVFAAYFTKM